MLNLKSLLTKLTVALGNAATLSSGTPTITTTLGTISNATYHRYGPIVHLSCTVKKTSSTSAGNNIITGTLTSTDLLPISEVRGTNYYGLRPIITLLDPDGNFYVRNAANQSLDANSATQSNLFYIAKNWTP